MSEIVVPLVGEPLALDLVNTRYRGAGGDEVDLLADRAGVEAWLAAESDRIPTGGTAGVLELDPLRDLRDHVAEAVERVRNGEEPPPTALASVNAALRSAPCVRALSWNDAGVTATARRSGDPTLDLLAELAEAAADLLTDPAVRRIRRCEGAGCRLLFLPGHPRRRWCSPATCGNRARVARYYRRHKGS